MKYESLFCFFLLNSACFLLPHFSARIFCLQLTLQWTSASSQASQPCRPHAKHPQVSLKILSIIQRQFMQFLLFVSFSLLSIFWHPNPTSGMSVKRRIKQRSNNEVPKDIYLHELPHTEIVKSETVRLDSVVCFCC